MFKLLLRSCCLILLLTALCASQEATLPDAPQQQTKPPNASPDDKPETQKIVGALAQVKNLPAEWLIGPYIPSAGPLIPLTRKQRLDVYFKQNFLNAAPYVLHLFTAGIDQARNYPSQWGGGLAAYGERFGNRYGRSLIANSFAAAGNAVMHYEPRYDLCRCKRFWPRTGHAIMRNFLTYDNTERKMHFAAPLYAGAFGAGMISATWLPGSQSVWRDGAYSVLSQAGWGSAQNWVSEFAVDILRKITKRNYPRNSTGGEP